MTSVEAQPASQSMPAITASARTAQGKTAARRLRASGQVPAVAYGKGLPSTALAVAPKDILSVLKSERGQNSVVKLNMAANKDILVMIRDFTYHPLTRSLEHVDFVEVKLGEPVDVEIPLTFTGKAAGVVLGGIVRQVYRTLPVRCTPDLIPTKVEVDVTELKLNEHISAKDIALPAGVTVRLAPEQTVIAIVAPEKDRTEDAAAAAPGAAPAKGAPAAAPAKAAAAPAKDAKKK